MKPARSRSVIAEWLIISICLTTLAILLSGSSWLWRLDQLIYDAQLRFWQQPSPADIVIVAIDDASLSKLGRWPWERDIHAQLLDKLTAAEVKAVALDILFSEKNAQNPQADNALVNAVANNGNVILPVVIEQTQRKGQLRESLPFPELSQNAAALGHVHIELDPDGMARNTYLMEGLGSAFWPSLAVAILRQIDPDTWQALPGKHNSSIQKEGTQLIFRDNKIAIPFAGPPGTFRYLSYNQVLDGSISAAELKDKIILVGATATGLGDHIPTPVSGLNQPMPGIEINANILNALRTNTIIQTLNTPAQIILALALVLLPLLFFQRLKPRQVLLLSAGMLFVTAGISATLLLGLHRWFPPTAIILALLTSYPLWSWRRLEYTTRYLDQELERLRNEPSYVAYPQQIAAFNQGMQFLQSLTDIDGWLLQDQSGQQLSGDGDLPTSPDTRFLQAGKWNSINNALWTRIPRQGANWYLGIHLNADTKLDPTTEAFLSYFIPSFNIEAEIPAGTLTELIERRVNQVGHAVNKQRTVQRLLSGILSQMEDGLIVANTGGNIILVNKQASAYLNPHPEGDSQERHIIEFAQQLGITGSLSWNDIFYKAFIKQTTVHFEAKHVSGTELYVQIAPWTSQEEEVSGIIITLSDISHLKRGERRRSEALSFLSHDLRSPLTSLLSLTHLKRKNKDRFKPGEFSDNVEYFANKALTLADSFLQLARAENINQEHFHELDFVAVMYNAIDEDYSAAQAKNIQLLRDIPFDEFWIVGDASLLERAIRNLIDNAIRHSQENSNIKLKLSYDQDLDQLQCHIQDFGEGIPSEHLSTIFAPFQRISTQKKQGTSGTGLGLAFVKTVAEKHNGSITVESEVGKGSNFCLAIPLSDDDSHHTENTP